jgi:hypothetical protein
MDAEGRAVNNMEIERLWRKLKQDEVYPQDSESLVQARHYNGNRSGNVTRDVPTPIWGSKVDPLVKTARRGS